MSDIGKAETSLSLVSSLKEDGCILAKADTLWVIQPKGVVELSALIPSVLDKMFMGEL